MDLHEINLLDADLFVSGRHHEAFAVLRAQDPFHWQAHSRGSGFWNVTKHADLVEVNRDIERFSSEWGGTQIFTMTESPGPDNRSPMMLDMDPPRHTRYRLLVNKGFTPRMVGLLEQALSRRATAIVDNVIEKGQADFVTEIASELPLQAIADILGVPQEDRFKMFDWSNRLIGAGDPEYMGQNMGAIVELVTYMKGLAAERRDDPRDDIITKLLGAEIDGDRLTDEEFDMFMVLLVVAGNETTRNATAHGIHALLTNVEQLHHLQADLDARLPLAVEEVLRWASPVLHFRRTATCDTTIGGRHEVRRGDKVVMWYVSANRDEDVFDDPFLFDITRDPNPHVAFGGGGPHFCLGANLARMELRLILREVLSRMPDLELIGDPSILRSVFIGGVKHLPVAWTPGPRVAPAA